MKTSNKIIYICLAFIIGVMIYDKYEIRQRYHKMIASVDEDKSKESSEITKKEPFNFHHVYVDGVNYGYVHVSDHQNFEGIEYQKNRVKRNHSYVKNDTLFVKYNDTLRNINLSRRSYLFDLHVSTDSLLSVTLKNVKANINVKNCKKIEVKALYSTEVYINPHAIDSLFVYASWYSKIRFQNDKKEQVGFVKMTADHNGVIDTRRIKVNKLETLKLGDGRIILSPTVSE